MTPLVVVDADVLGRSRTGDETYVLNLLRELAQLAPAAGLRIAAVTRHPELVPEGIEPSSSELGSRSCEWPDTAAAPPPARRRRSGTSSTRSRSHCRARRS